MTERFTTVSDQVEKRSLLQGGARFSSTQPKEERRTDPPNVTTRLLAL